MWANKLNTLRFKIVKRRGYGKGTDFRQNFVEFIGDNGYIPQRVIVL